MLYLMHLPKDVMRAIPMMNASGSALGGDVNIIDFVHFIVGIPELVYNGLVAGTNLLINFPTIMMNLGLAVINGLGQLGGAAIQAVAAATKVVVDAFNAFVAWAIDYFSETINRVLGTISNTIQSLINGQYLSMSQFSLSAHGDVHGAGGNVSDQTKVQLKGLVYGDFFWVLVGAATLVSLILLGFQVITLGFGFLTSIAIMMIAGELLKNAINYISSASGTSSTDFGKSAIMNEINGTLGSNQNEGVSDGVDIFDACFGIFTFIPEMAMFAVLKDKMDFALTLSMTLLAFMNLAIKDPIISVMTLGVSLICLAKLYCDMADIEDKMLVNLGLACSGGGIVISTVSLLI
jgi:hypothetical protein